MWHPRTLLSAAALVALSVAGIVTPLAVPPAPPPPRAAPPVSAPAPVETALGRRDTLQRALERAGASRTDALAIVAALRRSVDLRRLRPGEQLALRAGPDGALAAVSYQRSPIERYELRRDGAGWAVEAIRLPVEVRVVGLAGALEGSLFASIERLGEHPALTERLVQLLEWDFDFAADALPEDRFRVLVEKRHGGGEFLGYGEVLLAEYHPAGRAPLTAVAFAGEGGRLRHYDAQGRSIRKTFLRAPLEFTRITSGYSHARRHPVLGGLRPHLAVDYGAPTGTPVRAVADGVVTAAGWHGGYGISVTIRHTHGYETMYNHLSVALVRRGQRVAQRDVIGRVGSTGLSTGPHLDYRIRKHGVWVNPLGERFIPGTPVPAAQRPAFQARLERLRQELDRQTAAGRAG
jgi:murein DD-endopeptidase MepM/ murein hydrolase activator NlpD